MKLKTLAMLVLTGLCAGSLAFAATTKNSATNTMLADESAQPSQMGSSMDNTQGGSSMDNSNNNTNTDNNNSAPSTEDNSSSDTGTGDDDY